MRDAYTVEMDGWRETVPAHDPPVAAVFDALARADDAPRLRDGARVAVHADTGSRMYAVACGERDREAPAWLPETVSEAGEGSYRVCRLEPVDGGRSPDGAGARRRPGAGHGGDGPTGLVDGVNPEYDPPTLDASLDAGAGRDGAAAVVDEAYWSSFDG